MSELLDAVPIVRESVAAILRIHLVQAERMKKGRLRPARFNLTPSGTGFCVVANRYLVTAHHVLNNGSLRDPNDKFYAFIVPQNADRAFHFPIAGFPVERADVDLAVLELGPCVTGGIN